MDYTAALNAAVPEADVQLIPVASVMAELFLDGPLQGLSLDDLYVDSAPHGTETVYFLASMITYREVFGEAPPAGFDVPDVINPLVADNYDAINTRIGELLGDENTGGETPPVIVPNTDPSVENDLAELEQGEVAVIDVLFNDTDADGDTLTLQSVNGAIGGTTEIVDGRVVYTPDEDFSGADSFTYVVTDGEGGTVEGIVDVQVAEAEPEPEPEPEPTPEPPVVEGSDTAGFAVSYFKLADDVASLSDVNFDAEPDATSTVDALQYLEVSGAFAPETGEDNFASKYVSVLDVTGAGFHEVQLLADDYARVLLDGEVILDTTNEDSGSLLSRWIDFPVGQHEIEVQYIEIDGEQSLSLNWSGPSTGDAIEPLVGMVPTEDMGEETPVPIEPELPEEPIEEERPQEPVEEERPEEPVEEETPKETPEETPQVTAQTAFAATAIETTANSLFEVDFADHAGVSQITNGVTLASQDDELLEGGPSEGSVQFLTQISVETSGLYEIGLNADDQAMVAISGLPVVFTDEADEGLTQSNSIFLLAGQHTIDVRYMDTEGNQSLNVTWSGPDTDGEVLPIGDQPSDPVAALFSDEVSARSDEEAFEIAMREEDEDLFIS